MRVIQIDKDTLIVITPKQLQWTNSVILEREKLESKINNLSLLLQKQELNLTKVTSLNNKLREKNTKMLNDYSVLLDLNTTNDKLIEYYKEEVKIQRRKKTWGTVAGFTVGAGTGALLVFIFKK